MSDEPNYLEKAKIDHAESLKVNLHSPAAIQQFSLNAIAAALIALAEQGQAQKDVFELEPESIKLGRDFQRLVSPAPAEPQHPVCKKCGKPGELNRVMSGKYKVSCVTFGCDGETDFYLTPAAAWAAWDRRA